MKSTTKIVQAKLNSGKYLASLPCCAAFNACDIGQCQLETGEMVYMTWGSDTNPLDLPDFLRNSVLTLVLTTARKDVAEFIIPDDVAKAYLAMIKQLAQTKRSQTQTI